MERVVEGPRGVGDDAVHIWRGGLEEVDSWDVVDGIAILIKEEVEGDTMLTQVLDVDQGGEYVLAKSVVDQDLVDVLVCGTSGAADGLV